MRGNFEGGISISELEERTGGADRFSERDGLKDKTAKKRLQHEVTEKGIEDHLKEASQLFEDVERMRGKQFGQADMQGSQEKPLLEVKAESLSDDHKKLEDLEKQSGFDLTHSKKQIQETIEDVKKENALSQGNEAGVRESIVDQKGVSEDVFAEKSGAEFNAVKQKESAIPGREHAGENTEKQSDIQANSDEVPSQLDIALARANALGAKEKQPKGEELEKAMPQEMQEIPKEQIKLKSSSEDAKDDVLKAQELQEQPRDFAQEFAQQGMEQLKKLGIEDKDLQPLLLAIGSAIEKMMSGSEQQGFNTDTINKSVPDVYKRDQDAWNLIVSREILRGTKEKRNFDYMQESVIEALFEFEEQRFKKIVDKTENIPDLKKKIEEQELIFSTNPKEILPAEEVIESIEKAENNENYLKQVTDASNIRSRVYYFFQNSKVL